MSFNMSQKKAAYKHVFRAGAVVAPAEPTVDV
jgi:hypothetical protein